MSLNNFEKMEDPEERKPEDLVRKKEAKAEFKKKSHSKSVSLVTFRTGTGIVTLLVWIAFLAIVSYGTYQIVGMFASN